MRLPLSKVVLAGVLCLAAAGGCAPNTAAHQDAADQAAGRRAVATDQRIEATTQRTAATDQRATEGVVTTAAETATAPYCGISWGSGPKVRTPMSAAVLLTAKTSRHSCWDRVVFEFDGAVHGYDVRYGNRVLTDGEGLDLAPYTAGNAWLGVVLRAPAYDETGPTFNARTGAHVANVVRYRTLRDVVYGGSFEGSTLFAVGVRARLPFRVSIVAGPGSHTRIIVDVAHRWQQ
jgi:hypothetical protein